MSSSRLKVKKFYVTKTKECRGKQDVCLFLLLESARALSPPRGPWSFYQPA